MSSGGSFALIANDGKADRMIMATQLLLQRIQDTQCARKRAGKSDITPTLTDIERTHILYVNAHFKPFAAIGYEYNKVRPQSGTVTLGSGVTFSIPQFGDFFNDMVCRIRLSAFQGVAGTTPLQGTTLFPYSPANPTEGATGGGPYYNIVDAFGNLILPGSVASGSGGATTSYRNLVRYCEFPGNRIMVKTKFDVNGNPLDEYDTMIPVMMEKFCVAPNKRVGHDRLCGQQVPLTGYAAPVMALVTDSDKTSDVFNTPAGITRSNAAQSNQTVALYAAASLPVTSGTSQPTVIAGSTAGAFTALNAATHYDVSQQQLSIVNGPQTPKPVQPPLELWVKQQFWFNNDVRLSIASVCIPFGQRFITMDLAAQSLLTYEFPSIYLETINNVATDDVAYDGPLINRRKTYTPIHQKFGMTDITIEKMELYINNIFVNSEIHDIYIKRIGFSLIRVFRQHTAACNQEGADEKLLSNLKWPIEYMFVGLRPNWNVKDATVSAGAVTGNLNVWRDWHRLTRMVDASFDTPTVAENAFFIDPVGAVGVTDGDDAAIETIYSGRVAQGGSSIGKVIPNKYWLPVPTVDSLSLTSHGVTIYDNFNDTFFNQYAPLAYGGAALNTPEDPGALFVNMCLIPRAYQPSSHLNISRARETYIKWVSSYVSSKSPATLFVVAIAINFLLISDGSAILRYST